MTARSTLITCLASIAMLAFASTASAAQQPGVVSTTQAQRTTAAAPVETLSARERTQLSRALTGKWGNYVQRVYDVPTGVWTSRMASSLAIADASNLRNAMQRDTFEGAMAELNGTGSRMNDEKVIEALAASGGGASPQTLGALTSDLVYTPVTPCRIIDTRVAGGTITGLTSRSFFAFGIPNYTGQGGSATSCGVAGLSATAVAINLTAVFPAGNGFATAHPFGTARPLAASINYAAGAIVNNALIVQTPNPLASQDFTLYTFATSHYVADIVGYFAPPVATALQCEDVSGAATPIPVNSFAQVSAPACTAGFTQVSLNCDTSSFLNSLAGQRASARLCFFNNLTANTMTGTATVTCCRVPGR